MKTKIVMIAFMAMSFVVTGQNETVNGNLTVKGSISTVKNQPEVTYPSLTSRGDVMHFYRNVNNGLEIGVGGRSNTRRSWILSRHYDISGTYGKYYSTLHLQPDTGDKSQYRGVAIGYGANYTVPIGTHLAVNGNVGIGTVTPTQKLEVKGNVLLKSDSYVHYAVERGNGANSAYGITSNTHDAFLSSSGNLKFLTNNDKGSNTSTKMLLDINGNLGIGTKTPTQKLDVNGHVKFDALSSNNTNIQIGHDVNDRIFADNSPNKYYGGGLFFRVTPDASLNVPHNYIDAMILNDKGEVGIGTRNTKGFKLGVNGKIAATEVKVATYTNWPDFVFEKEYNLPTLKEVEDYIKTKGHLENIPSAKEVAKNGVLLGEMNKKLLQKIEELTLYTIQQEKEIEKLKEKNKEIKSLSERLAKLEKLLEK